MEILGFLCRILSAGWDPGNHPREVTIISDLARMVDPIHIRRIVAGWLDCEFFAKNRVYQPARMVKLDIFFKKNAGLQSGAFLTINRTIFAGLQSGFHYHPRIYDKFWEIFI